MFDNFEKITYWAFDKGITTPWKIEVATAMKGKETAMKGKETAVELLAITTKREAPKNGIVAEVGIGVVIWESMVWVFVESMIKRNTKEALIPN